MFIAALFPTAERWKQPKCPLSDGWIEKLNTYSVMLFSHEKEGNSDPCYNMDLENVMLSEISQTWRTNTAQFHLYAVPRVVIFIETKKNRMVAAGAGEDGS